MRRTRSRSRTRRHPPSLPRRSRARPRRCSPRSCRRRPPAASCRGSAARRRYHFSVPTPPPRVSRYWPAAIGAGAGLRVAAVDRLARHLERPQCPRREPVERPDQVVGARRRRSTARRPASAMHASCSRALPDTSRPTTSIRRSMPSLASCAGHLARRRRTGRLPVGDQHDRPVTLTAEVLAGLAERMRDGRLAVRLVAGDRPAQLVAVVGARRHDLLGVRARPGVVAREHRRAVHPQPDLCLVRQPVDHGVQRRLGRLDLGLAARRRLAHRARGVEHQLHPADLLVRCRRRPRGRRSGCHPDRRGEAEHGQHHRDHQVSRADHPSPPSFAIAN